MKKVFWFAVAVLGAYTLGGIALNRGETVNATWIITAAVCVYALGYRFYSAWVAAEVLTLDAMRATPAQRLNNGRDFVPTNKWIVFGHHFAAIAGPGPLVGPTLAAQFGYLPGLLWILVGSVIGGCVQDMTILFLSTRRDGRSIGKMARDELGPIGGYAAMIGTLMILIILIAVLGLIVVNAMQHSPWATATVFATIPIAMLVGVYLRSIRPGRVIEASALGFALLMLAVVGGGWIKDHATLAPMFDLDALQLAWFVMGYGFAAAIVPVWLLLAPRDYLSTFLKIGTVILLAVAVVSMHPDIKMPAVTQFIDGTGPVFGGKLFPFVFITMACGAISGFHALVSSGTTPKLIGNEIDVRPIGYGSMMMESFVAVIALIAATLLEPGIYFAINSPAGIVGATAEAAVQTISSWGFPVTVQQMHGTRDRDGREHAVCAHRRCAVACGRHGDDSGIDVRPGDARGLVSLRDHVRGGVHPDDARCRHARRPVHGAGSARSRVAAARTNLLVSVGGLCERGGGGGLGLLLVHRRDRSERRREYSVADVRHRQSDARGDCAVGCDRRHRQAGQIALCVGDRGAACVACDRHDVGRMAEDLRGRTAVSASSPARTISRRNSRPGC